MVLTKQVMAGVKLKSRGSFVLGAGAKHLKGVLTLEAKVDVAVKHVCPKRLR